MFQPLSQGISPVLPNFDRAARVAHLPYVMQTCMTHADGAEEVVEEVDGRPPAEVLVLQWMSFSLENPVGWYLRNVCFLQLVVA